jgi:hypothetical protein
MCLLLEAVAPISERSTLDAAAIDARVGGLRVDLCHASRWGWAQTEVVRATISEDGGCACSLLSDEADWNAERWSMRPDVLERLASTLEVLARRGPRGLFIEALWSGETARETISVAPLQLAHLARHSGLGTHTRYIVVEDNAG